MDSLKGILTQDNDRGFITFWWLDKVIDGGFSVFDLVFMCFFSVFVFKISEPNGAPCLPGVRSRTAVMYAPRLPAVRSQAAGT